MKGRKLNVFLKQRTEVNKVVSVPKDWEAYKEMLLNIRLAVAVDPRPDAAVRHLARTWYAEQKYAIPVCQAALLKLMTLKKANTTLEEMIALYINLEEESNK